jgi:hypothetical protein
MAVTIHQRIDVVHESGEVRIIGHELASLREGPAPTEHANSRPRVSLILDDVVEFLEERGGFLAVRSSCMSQPGQRYTKANARTVVSADPPSIPIRAARHSSLRVGSPATCAIIISMLLSRLAMSVLI